MKTFLSFLVTIIFIFLNAQDAPEIKWENNFGGTSSDSASGLVQTSDGNLIIVGSTNSSNGDVSGYHGNTDGWIIKLNNLGELIWQKALGGSRGDLAISIDVTTDGGFVIAGISSSIDGDVVGNSEMDWTDFWIVKFDTNGVIQWQKFYGGSWEESPMSIQTTTDGGFIVAGRSASDDGDLTHNNGNYDFWIIKLDESGNLEWQKSLGGSGNDYANQVISTLDGGYIVVGESFSNDGDVSGNNGNGDFWVVKVNNIGDLEWQKSLGGSEYDFANSVQLASDGGYIISGQAYSSDGYVTENNGERDFWIVKLSEEGNILWEKSFGGTLSEGGRSIKVTSDGGYIIVGESESNDGDLSQNQGNTDYWIVKLKQNGEIQWQKSMGGSGGDWPFQVIQTQEGGYAIAGFSGSNDGDVSGNNGYADIWVVKLGPDYMSTSESHSAEILIYPNPVKSILNFSEKLNDIQIYNLTGQMILKTSEKDAMNVDYLNSGTYILKAKSQKGENIQLKFLKN